LRAAAQALPQARQAVATVWAVPEVRSAAGRARAFLKFALIERRLDMYLGVRRTSASLPRCPVSAAWVGAWARTRAVVVVAARLVKAQYE
jgi:hypothetical protein